MDKNESIIPEEKKDNSRKSVICSLMVMAVLLIVDLYVMINMPGNFLVLAIVTILFLVSAYFFGNAILKEIQNSKMQTEEQYEAIAKSGKASYILLKKAYEQLEEIEGNSKISDTEDIITAQKAIAKVTINRSKENTDALMNSNDKVLEKFFSFEENLENSQSDLLDKQRDIIDNSIKELVLKQQEMTSTMKAMEESIKSELLSAMSEMQVAQSQVTQSQVTVEDFDLGEPETIEDINLGEPETIEDFDLGEPETIEEDSIDNFGLEDDLNLGSDIGLEDDLNFGSDIGLEDDLNLGSDIGLEDDLDLGSDIEFGEPSLSADLDLGIDLLPEEESIIEEPISNETAMEPEFAEEEDTAMPDLSNPNKMMTPEEIAALIAKM